MRQYYYAQDGESHGPVGPAEFRALGLPPTTLIWRAEHNDWLPAAQIPDLVDTSPLPTPSRQEKREAEPKRHVPHPTPVPVSTWQPPTAPPRQASRGEVTPKRKRERTGDVPIPTPKKGSGFSLWRLLFVVVMGWFIWSKNHERFAATPDLSPPPAATTPAPEMAEAPTTPETPAAPPTRSSVWQQEAEEPLRHLVLAYTPPARLTGETTLSGILRSEAHALTYTHAMVQIAFTNAEGALLVKDWRPLDIDLAPGGQQAFTFQVKAPAAAAAVQLEVLRAEVK